MSNKRKLASDKNPLNFVSISFSTDQKEQMQKLCDNIKTQLGITVRELLEYKPINLLSMIDKLYFDEKICDHKLGIEEIKQAMNNFVRFKQEWYKSNATNGTNKKPKRIAYYNEEILKPFFENKKFDGDEIEING